MIQCNVLRAVLVSFLFVLIDCQIDNICSNEAACGWESYDAITRVREFVVQSPCVCEVGKKCKRVYDDTYMSIFVYQCISNESNSNTLPPPNY